MIEDPQTVRQIIHLDMDAFYAAVEMLDNPALRGKPVIVGGTRERGVVSSASYTAREIGVHSAQPIATAMRLCPQGVFLPVRMARYKEVSGRIFNIFRLFTPLVEPLSIDEAFLDVTGTQRLFGSGMEIAGRIKQMVREKTGLTVSAGVAPSKFVAKIASDFQKPDGLTVVRPEEVTGFLDPLPISCMWGIGEVTRKALGSLGVRTFKDLRLLPLSLLERRFGRHGRDMHNLAKGIDPRAVVPMREAKSVGHEHTFPEDITDRESAQRELLSLAGKVARRLRRNGVGGKTVTLKVKYGDFKQITRSSTLPVPTDDAGQIFERLCRQLENTAVGKKPVRLLGAAVSQLSFTDGEHQMGLFEENCSFEKRRTLNRALDRIADKFGEETVAPATLLRKPEN
jgi:DNA polymerase-4